MSKTVINVKETIGKTVGRTDVTGTDPGAASKATSLHQDLPVPMPRRGTVHRFHTHEEADAWLMNLQSSAKRQGES